MKFQKKGLDQGVIEKQTECLDPFVSDGINSLTWREYVKGLDERKREYAPKIMVATST